MTSATLLILGMRMRVEWNYIRYVILGGVFGLFMGTYWIVPLISPIMAKLFFVSLWLSFGIVLWRANLRLSEKVATPSSVIIMTIETLLGFFLHVVILKDFAPESFELWLTCVPVVVFFAPLGAFVMSKLPRQKIAQLLYSILIIQFIGAIIVIRPNALQLLLCVGSLVLGLSLFTYLSKLDRKAPEAQGSMPLT